MKSGETPTRPLLVDTSQCFPPCLLMRWKMSWEDLDFATVGRGADYTRNGLLASWKCNVVTLTLLHPSHLIFLRSWIMRLSSSWLMSSNLWWRIGMKFRVWLRSDSIEKRSDVVKKLLVSSVHCQSSSIQIGGLFSISGWNDHSSSIRCGPDE